MGSMWWPGLSLFPLVAGSGGWSPLLLCSHSSSDPPQEMGQLGAAAPLP